MSNPRSYVRLYDVTDLTPDYAHTRYFQTDALRDAYFYARRASGLNGEILPWGDWTQVQHIRIDEGKIKLPFPIKEIHGYTYMSIRNSKGTNDSLDHFYYCFITDMEYVSDMCTMVYFKVDVVQTFWNSFTSYQSLVERTHSETDTFGDNIKAEPFRPTEFIVNDDSYPSHLQTMCLVIGISCSDPSITVEWQDGLGQTQTHTFDMSPIVYYKNIFTCVRYLVITEDMLTSAMFIALLNYFRQNDAEHAKEIVEMYMCPEVCIPSTEGFFEVGTGEATPSVVDTIGVIGVPLTDNYRKLNGYEPVNQKMYCYPYNFLRATNGEGEFKDYAYEYFNINHVGNTPQFMAEGSFIGDASITIYPMNYKRTTSSSKDSDFGHDKSVSYNNFEGLTLTDYPHGAWNVDSYALYQSQNQTANGLKLFASILIGSLGGFMLGGGVGLVGSLMQGAELVTAEGALMGAGYGAFMGGFKESASQTAEKIKAKNTADQSFGGTTGRNVTSCHGHKNFAFYRMTVDEQYAKMVDDYFTMYGYVSNEIMNIRDHLNVVKQRRRHYCYIKTTNFIIQGEIENKYKMELGRILNNGITFWYKTDEPMCDYTVDNKVVVG